MTSPSTDATNRSREPLSPHLPTPPAPLDNSHPFVSTREQDQISSYHSGWQETLSHWWRALVEKVTSFISSIFALFFKSTPPEETATPPASVNQPLTNGITTSLSVQAVPAPVAPRPSPEATASHPNPDTHDDELNGRRAHQQRDSLFFAIDNMQMRTLQAAIAELPGQSAAGSSSAPNPAPSLPPSGAAAAAAAAGPAPAAPLPAPPLAVVPTATSSSSNSASSAALAPTPLAAVPSSSGAPASTPGTHSAPASSPIRAAAGPATPRREEILWTKLRQYTETRPNTETRRTLQTALAPLISPPPGEPRSVTLCVSNLCRDTETALTIALFFNELTKDDNAIPLLVPFINQAAQTPPPGFWEGAFAQWTPLVIGKVAGVLRIGGWLQPVLPLAIDRITTPEGLKALLTGYEATHFNDSLTNKERWPKFIAHVPEAQLAETYDKLISVPGCDWKALMVSAPKDHPSSRFDWRRLLCLLVEETQRAEFVANCKTYSHVDLYPRAAQVEEV